MLTALSFAFWETQEMPVWYTAELPLASLQTARSLPSLGFPDLHLSLLSYLFKSNLLLQVCVSGIS